MLTAELEGLRGVDAGVDERPDDAARVATAPPDRELGRAEIADRHADDAGAVIHDSASLGKQGNRRAGRDDLEILVGGGHLRGDDRGPCRPARQLRASLPAATVGGGPGLCCDSSPPGSEPAGGRLDVL